MGHLDKRKLADNTIVVYVTDNGWINSEKASRYAPRSKRSQYDGGLRTPIMVRWPDKVAPKMDKTTPVNAIDLAPTLLAACGLAPTKDMDGVNLLDKDALAKRDAIFGEILEHDIQHMTDPVPSLMYRWVIRGKWKLIVPTKHRVPNGKVELFDLQADPHERKNVATSQSDLVDELTKRLDAWWPGK